MIEGNTSETRLEDLSKEELISLIRVMNETHSERVADLQKKLDAALAVRAELEERHRLAILADYSASSEQMYFTFDDIEAISQTAQKQEEEVLDVKAHKKRKPKKRGCEASPNTPVFDVYDYDVNDVPNEVVNSEGILMRRIEDRIVEQVTIVPQRILVERHHHLQYVAVDAISEEANKLQQWGLPENMSRLGISLSTIAYIAVCKFDDHLPLYRIEEILARSGLYYSRQKMARHLVEAYSQLGGYESRLRSEVLSSAFVNRDETPVQVLSLRTESGRISQSSYMLVTVGTTYDVGSRSTHAVRIFEFISGRSKKHVCDGLDGFTGYVMTDGFAGYNKLERHCSCWAHILRRFKNKAKELKSKKGSELKDWLRSLLLGISGIWTVDSNLREKLHSGEISTVEFLERRRSESLPLMDSFFDSIEKKAAAFTPASAMGKAISYALDRKESSRLYLDVVEATPDNNAAENAIRPFTVGRANWHFFQSVDGCDASSLFYSMIETAKCYQINPLDYVEYVLRFGLGKPSCECGFLMPWNFDRQKLEQARAPRATAAPIAGRTEPFSFRGATS